MRVEEQVRVGQNLEEKEAASASSGSLAFFGNALALLPPQGLPCKFLGTYHDVASSMLAILQRREVRFSKLDRLTPDHGAQ